MAVVVDAVTIVILVTTTAKAVTTAVINIGMMITTFVITMEIS